MGDRPDCDRPLYCALLDIAESFAISADLFDAGGVWLNPGEEAIAPDWGPAEATIPPEFASQGITEYKDVLKLIVSLAEFDVRLLNQTGLDLPRTRSVATEPQGMLNQLFGRIQTRELKPRVQANAFDDWMTRQVVVITVRPKETVPLSDVSQANLSAGIKVLPHSALKAEARLTTVNQSTRDLGSHILPPLLRDQTQPFQFTASRATDPGLSALELRNVQNREAVTPDNPLRVVADVPLEDGA